MNRSVMNQSYSTVYVTHSLLPETEDTLGGERVELGVEVLAGNWINPIPEDSLLRFLARDLDRELTRWRQEREEAVNERQRQRVALLRQILGIDEDEEPYLRDEPEPPQPVNDNYLSRERLNQLTRSSFSRIPVPRLYRGHSPRVYRSYNLAIFQHGEQIAPLHPEERMQNSVGNSQRGIRTYSSSNSGGSSYLDHMAERMRLYNQCRLATRFELVESDSTTGNHGKKKRFFKPLANRAKKWAWKIKKFGRRHRRHTRHEHNN